MRGIPRVILAFELPPPDIDASAVVRAGIQTAELAAVHPEVIHQSRGPELQLAAAQVEAKQLPFEFVLDDLAIGSAASGHPKPCSLQELSSGFLSRLHGQE